MVFFYYFRDKGAVVVEPNVEIKVQFFGEKLEIVKAVLFTLSHDSCDPYAALAPEQAFLIDQPHSVAFHIELPYDQSTYYVCFAFRPNLGGNLAAKFKINETLKTVDAQEWAHQGVADYATLKTRHHVKVYYMPMWIQIIVITVLLLLSGLFSGLNLGLMSLDKTELKIILKVGDGRERNYAEKIYPIRKSGNYLLCTLLLGNVVVNSSISILFDDLTTGYIALVVASLGIVIFGEIIPQAICSRYGLAVGARTVYVTRFFMILTFPLSWPISKALDKILGEEVGQVYNRERLLELIRMSKEYEKDLGTCQEVQIVTGALELSRKIVSDVMTPFKDVFMLPSDAILDPKAVSEIVKSGYTRIPVYDPNNRNNIVYILNVKDLALLDPEDKIPLMTICQFYQHPVRFVMEDSPLSIMLEEFKKGHYHLAIVQRINSEGEGDPTYEAVGLISLEDVIEEIIQSEIRDEFDIIRDSRLKRMRRKETLAAVGNAMKDLTIFFNTDIDACDVSPQLTLATYQYLSTNLDVFNRKLISENVLHRLIRQNVIKTKPGEAYEQIKYLFQKNREADYFILILEGKALITVGESNMIFEPGPFHYFGYEVLVKVAEHCPHYSVSALNHTIFDMPAFRACKFTPDFTLKVTQELIYLKITANSYMKAYRATLIEHGLAFRQQDTSSSIGSDSNLNAVIDGQITGKSLPNVNNGGNFISRINTARSMDDQAMDRKYSLQDNNILSASDDHTLNRGVHITIKEESPLPDGDCNGIEVIPA